MKKRILVSLTLSLAVLCAALLLWSGSKIYAIELPFVPAEKTTQSTTKTTTEKATEKVTEKVTEKATEKATEKVTEKATERATEKANTMPIIGEETKAVETTSSSIDVTTTSEVVTNKVSDPEISTERQISDVASEMATIIEPLSKNVDDVDDVKKDKNYIGVLIGAVVILLAGCVVLVIKRKK